MIFFDKVTKIYAPSSTILDDVNFTVEPNEFVSLVGQSGAGKTTLLRMLIGEEKPTSGQVFLDSIDIHSIKNKDIPTLRRKIGVIFQDFKLLPHKTAYENIAFAMQVAGKTEEEIATDVPHVLELVDLVDKSWHFPRELSGGERQRVAIARAIVNRPDIIIADEPTGNLDPLNTWEIINILKKINELGTTVLMATHNKGIIDSLGKRVITLEKGKIIRDDKNGRYVL